MLSPSKQREAETVLGYVKRLVNRHGSHAPFIVGRERTRLRIVPNYSTASTISVHSLAPDESLMIATWNPDDDSEPPVFIKFRNGFWGEIVRQELESHHGR